MNDPSVAAPIRVLIVEDQVMLADALARLIGQEEDLVVVGSTAGVVEALAVARREQPDVVLMDFSLPDGDGMAATREIKKSREETKVVMLTGFGEASVLEAAIEAGCSGFLTKDRAAAEVVQAVRKAHEGESVIEPALLAAMLARMRRGAGKPRARLSCRELEVLVLLAKGVANRDIAEQMVVSVHTVRSHVQNLMMKLEAHSKLEAVAKAVRQGIIPPT